MAYVVCEKCRGYYELQERESFEDFRSCQCGGKLKHVESIENIDELDITKNICSQCGKEIFNGSKLCERCQRSPKKPWLAGLLSLILPGLGHFYAGSIIIGFIGLGLFILWLLSNIYYPPSYPWFSFIPSTWQLIIYASIAGHAFWTAKKWNRDIIKESINNKSSVCPDCGFEDTKTEEYCINCGKDLRNTLFYACGNVSIINASDIEITSDQLIEYKKGIFGKKRYGKIKEYNLNEMGNILINDRMMRLCSPFPFPYISLEFDYGERRERVYIPENYIDSLIETLKSLNVSYDDHYYFSSLNA